MTSSDPQPPLPIDPGVASPPPAIVAGHLHPGMLFLRFLDGLRQMIIPCAIAAIADLPWLIIAAIAFFMLAMIHAFARYITFQYRLTEEELITTEGILHRQERRIPINRVQDLSFESTIVRRIFGLVVVSVETASSQGAEARFDSLSRRNAERLREALFQTRAGADVSAGTVAEPPGELLIYRVSSGELTLLGLTNNRVGVIFAALYGVFELADQFGFIDQMGGLAGSLLDRLIDVHWSLVIVLALAVLFVALLGGWLVSIIASFVMFHGFTLSVREDVFQRRYGLLTTRAASLPLRKIQRVLLEQTFLRRVFGLTVVKADSAGSGMNPAEEARGGRDIVVPLTRNDRAEAVAPVFLSGMQAAGVDWNRVSPRVILRIFVQGVILAGIGLALGLPTVGSLALVSLLCLPLFYAIGVLSFQNLAYAQEGAHIVMRWGILGRYRAIVPLQKVQAVVIHRNPLERMLGLARLTVYVAGGSPSTMSNLPSGEAMRLRDDLASQAASSHFVW